MSLLKKLTPLNLLEEKEKFLANPKYNPQFIYQNPIETSVLTRYGLPRPKYLKLAKKIVATAYRWSTEEDLLAEEGRIVNKKSVEKKINHFLSMHGLEHKYKLIFSSSFVSRTSITSELIKVRLPIQYREKELISMIYHEIGTHALRRVNYEQQPWFKKKKKYKFRNYLKTEEGLAIINGLLPRNNKLVFKPALRYMATNLAQHHSFSELWSLLSKYIKNETTRWEITFRQKRGLENTSLPGGFTKDLVYLAGFVEVTDYLKTHDYDISKLYFGKMSYLDIDKAIKMNPNFEPLLPSFFTIDRQEYAKQIKNIIKINTL